MPILSKTELFKILPSEAHDVVFKAHRLNELRRLQGREQTQSFIDDRGIVSLFTGTELPSIQEAIEGTLASVTHDGIIKSGFGIAWIWAQDLPDPSRCMCCLFLRDKTTFITCRHWTSLVAMGSPDHHQARKAKHISAMANILLAGIDATLAVNEAAVFRWFGRNRSITGRLVKGLLERKVCFRGDGSNPILISQTLVDAWPRV